MIDQERMIAKVMPEYEEAMRSIEAQRARRDGLIIEENAQKAEDEIAERIKDKIMHSATEPQRADIYKMLLEARVEWLKQLNYNEL